MKKLVPFFATLLLAVGLSLSAQAQCPSSNPDSDPCFSLPAGPCCIGQSGKYRLWIAKSVIQEAKPYLDQDFKYSLGQYLWKYYREGSMQISYLGGDWSSGQQFRVELAPCIVIISIDGL